MLSIHLRDINPERVAAWKQAFSGAPDVHTACGDIFAGRLMPSSVQPLCAPRAISETANVYLAFRAALISSLAYNQKTKTPIESVIVPGLGTGIGGMPSGRAARQMKLAYESVLAGRSDKTRSAGQIWAEHRELLR